MPSLVELLKRPAALAIVAGTVLALTSIGVNAATVTFDQNAGTATVPATDTTIVVPGSAAGGTLLFNLTLGADYTSPGDLSPGANGSFTLEVDTASTPFWSYAVLAASPSTPGSMDYGDYTGPGAVLASSSITDTSTWTVGIVAGDFPVTLTLGGTFSGYCPNEDACFTPDTTFSYDFTPNTAVTPLPASLPLFATGMAVVGWVGSRRRKKNPAISV